MLCLLAACSGAPDEGPVGWWHQFEGGPIAQNRPPPPGQTDPYPLLSSVPPAPKPVAPEARARTYAALAVDRANATYEARLDPLADTGAKRDSNGLFAPAAAPAPAQGTAGAALDAATPPAPAPSAKARLPQTVPPSPADTPIPDIAPDTGAPPPIPAAPPPQPRIAGVALPVTIPHLPPQAPPTKDVIAALTAAQRAPVSLGFQQGSALLTVQDRASLATLAAARGKHRIQLVGFGEADQEDPTSQYLGVRLGLARARAAAMALEGDGVPEAALQIGAAAPGRGAAAQLIE
jgi:outer membrane protein OmpA-like peptidoglycan-associated protein